MYFPLSLFSVSLDINKQAKNPWQSTQAQEHLGPPILVTRFVVLPLWVHHRLLWAKETKRCHSAQQVSALVIQEMLSPLTKYL